MIELEVEALRICARARLSITDARLTPGQRYRVTITPADAPGPEPVDVRPVACWVPTSRFLEHRP